VAQNGTLLRKYLFPETLRSHVELNQVSMIGVPTLFFFHLQILLYRKYCVKSQSVMMLRVVFFDKCITVNVPELKGRMPLNHIGRTNLEWVILLYCHELVIRHRVWIDNLLDVVSCNYK
jgi:hypothetical protein